MSLYPGYKCKVTIGTVTIAEMNKWGLPGKVNKLIESSKFEGAFETFVYGQAQGGQVSFSGFFDDSDTTGQDILLAAYANKTNIANLRVYYGTAVTQFFHLVPGATLYIETIDIGEADISGLVPISFTLKASGGYFDRCLGYYSDDDLTFAHVAGANNDTITKSGGTSFVTLGYVAGQRLIVEGSSDNDGSYTLHNVAANVLTLTNDTITAESAGAPVSRYR